MFSAVMILFGVFVLGAAVGNRFTIYALNHYLRELDREEQIRRLRELTGYKK